MVRETLRATRKAISGKVLRGIFRVITATGWFWPLVRYLEYQVKQVEVEATGQSKPRLTILALNPDRFAGDLEALAATGEFRILRAPLRFQQQLVGFFYPKHIFSYFSHHSKEGERARNRFIKFLRPFLKQAYARLSIDCVIGAAHYQQDVDWGRVSHDLGVPYVVLFKENLQASKEHRLFSIKKGKSLGSFGGTHIIVHSGASSKNWTDSGFVASDQISALGALRMDRYLDRIRNINGSDRARKRVVFFSFARGTSLAAAGIKSFPEDPNAGFSKFFCNAHAAFAELAAELPEVDFVFKLKWPSHTHFGRVWVDEIRRAMSERGMESLSSNLIIDSEVDAQDIIIDSDVVVSFGSTTLIEGAISMKPVIVPFFDEAAEDQYADHILLRSAFNMFDVAKSPAALKSLIRNKLSDPTVEPSVQKARIELFETYLSPADGGATKKYVEKLKSIISSHTVLTATSSAGVLPRDA